MESRILLGLCTRYSLLGLGTPSPGEGLRPEEEEEEEEMDPDRTLLTVDEDEEMDFGDPPEEVVFPEAPPQTPAAWLEARARAGKGARSTFTEMR